MVNREQILNEFKETLGGQQYSSCMARLKNIGPDSRTHRISVVIASILRVAVDQKPPD